MSKGGSHGSHLLGNSIWNASSFVVSVALNLLVLPFVLYRLGANAFGIASLVTACTAPALAFSNALALSTTRELAARLAAEHREEAKQMFATALFVGIGAGLAIAAVLGLLAPPLAARVFHLEGSGVDLNLAFLLGAGGWFCQCLSVVFVALFTARQDYSRVATTGLISVVVATIAIVVLVPLRPTVSTYLGCQALGLAAGLIASCMAARSGSANGVTSAKRAASGRRHQSSLATECWFRIPSTSSTVLRIRSGPPRGMSRSSRFSTKVIHSGFHWAKARSGFTTMPGSERVRWCCAA